ncbi:unnamed protein product [Effrenium voratum]|nr:unnamed protein product [Effrenium voratum]
MAKRRAALIPRLAAIFVLGSVLNAAFIAPRPARPHILRRAEAEAVTLTEPEPTEPAESQESVPLEGSVTIVQGASRVRVPWAPEETCATLRARVEEATGVPVAKQQLKLAKQELLGEEDETQQSYEANGKIRTIWLEDLRTPAERGEEEETIIDQLKQLWKLDNVTVVSLVLAAYTIVKELLPLIINGVKSPVEDLPWQPGPIDAVAPSPSMIG